MSVISSKVSMWYFLRLQTLHLLFMFYLFKFTWECILICLNQSWKYENENQLWKYSLSLYCETGKMLLEYLNVIFSRQPFEYIFLTFRPSIDYNKNSLKILNLKWRFFVVFWMKRYGKNFQYGLMFLFLRKKTRTHSF